MKKWKDKTRGGDTVELWKEADGRIYGRMKSHRTDEWMPVCWRADTGSFVKSGDVIDDWDLLPKEPERIVIERVRFVTYTECNGQQFIYPEPERVSYWDLGLKGKFGRLIFEVEDEG